VFVFADDGEVLIAHEPKAGSRRAPLPPASATPLRNQLSVASREEQPCAHVRLQAKPPLGR
jgi:hypothetical protein